MVRAKELARLALAKQVDAKKACPLRKELNLKRLGHGLADLQGHVLLEPLEGLCG